MQEPDAEAPLATESEPESTANLPIVSVTQYLRGDSRVEEFKPIEGHELPEGVPRFVGFGKAAITNKVTGQTVNLEYNFPIYMDTIEKAYSIFDTLTKAAANDAAKTFMEQQKEAQQKGPGLVLPNGPIPDEPRNGNNSPRRSRKSR